MGLLDLGGLGHNGLVHDAREAGGQLSRRTKRRMALGGTLADLRMLSSKPAGSAIDVNEEQPQKASQARLVRPAGSSIDVNEEQP